MTKSSDNYKLKVLSHTVMFAGYLPRTERITCGPFFKETRKMMILKKALFQEHQYFYNKKDVSSL